MISSSVRGGGKNSAADKPRFDLMLDTEGYRLNGEFESFGPTRDPQAFGTIVFGLGLEVTVQDNDPGTNEFAHAMFNCSASLVDIEQGAAMRLAPDFKSEHVEQWAKGAASVCSSKNTAAKVAHQVHWLLDPVVVQVEQRRKAMIRAKDWLQACFDCAVDFAHTAESLEHYSEPTSATASARCLAGYHLLRGAAKLYRPPALEELEAGFDDEGPEDVRLGYVELDLSLAHLHFGERLKAWEFALRYKPAFIDFEPDSRVVTEWLDSICHAYISHFGDVLEDADSEWPWRQPNLGVDGAHLEHRR